MKTVHNLSLFLAVGALALFLSTGCKSEAKGPDLSAAKTVGVSAVKNAPDQYLGPVIITGLAANVYPAEGVIEIADEKACCALYLLIPFDENQNAKLQRPNLYQGQYPAQGAPIAVAGVLSKVDKGYDFQVEKIKSGQQVLISTK